MRLLVPVLAAGLLAGGLPAAPVPLPAKFDPPTVTGQAASLPKLVEQALGLVAPSGAASREDGEKGLASVLGPDGWKGFDEKKPVAAYSYLRAKLAASVVVLVVPITDEKDALATLGKLNLPAEADDRRKGVYVLGKHGLFSDERPTLLRFHDGHAYVAFNASPDDLPAEGLPPAGALVRADEKAPLALTLHPARAPKELKELLDGWWAGGRQGVVQMENQAAGAMPKSFPGVLKAGLGWLDASTASVFADADAVTVRLATDAKTNAVTVAVTVGAKGKTELAKSVAAIQPPPARFHQLVTKETVFGGWLAAGPGLNEDFRRAAGAFAAEMLPRNAPADDLKPLFTDLGRVIETGLADGKADWGFGVSAANKDGAHTAVVAVACDPAGVEKAARKLTDELPKEAKGRVKWEAEKGGALAVHTYTTADGAEGWEKVFGKAAVVRWAFGTDAVYVAFGPDGLAEITRAVALKPTAGKRLDVVVNPEKVGKLFGGGEFLERMFGTGDAPRSVFGVDVTGGKELTVTYTQSGAGLFGGMFMSMGVGGRAAPPRVAPPPPPPPLPVEK